MVGGVVGFAGSGCCAAMVADAPTTNISTAANADKRPSRVFPGGGVMYRGAPLRTAAKGRSVLYSTVIAQYGATRRAI